MKFASFNKYHNTKIKTSDGVFDSKAELSRWTELLYLQKARKITALKRQVRIKLGVSDKCKCYYKADFVYFDNGAGVWIVEDLKGFKTSDFMIKLKWLLDTYVGFVFRLTNAKDNTIKEFKPFNDEGLNLELKICSFSN